MSDPVSPEKIKAWLDAEKLDRSWLASQCGVSKPTVNGWLSAGRLIPSPKLEIIRRLMNPDQDTASSIRLHFEHGEWVKIETARELVGRPPHKEFYQTAIIDYADRLIASEKAKPGKIVVHPSATMDKDQSRKSREKPMKATGTDGSHSNSSLGRKK